MDPATARPFEIITTCQQTYLETRLLPFSFTRFFMFDDDNEFREFLEHIPREKLACIKSIRIGKSQSTAMKEFRNIDARLWLKLSGLEKIEVTPRSVSATVMNDLATMLWEVFGLTFQSFMINVYDYENFAAEDDGMMG